MMKQGKRKSGYEMPPKGKSMPALKTNQLNGNFTYILYYYSVLNFTFSLNQWKMSTKRTEAQRNEQETET